MSVVKLKSLPIWMPDSALDHCPICRSSFGFFFRRHHCRICGGLVCADCSGSYHVLSLLGTSPQRVCDLCDKAVRVARTGKEIDELDDHLEKISQYINLNVKQNIPPQQQQQQQQPPPQQQPPSQQPETITTLAPKKEEPTQNQSVSVDDDNSEVELEQESSVVVGSVQSTGSVVIPGDDDDCVVSHNNTGFMSDLIHTPDTPAPAPTTPSKTTQDNSTGNKTPQLTVHIDDATANATTPLTTPTTSNVNTNPCETPSGRKAQQRTQYGSLKRSINRPTQHGTQHTTLSSHGQNKLRTLKRNQLEGLIKQAQMTAVVQEIDPKKAGTSTDTLDVNSLLTRDGELTVSADVDVISPLSPRGESSSASSSSKSIPEDSVPVKDEPISQVISPTSSTASTAANYPTHNITQSGRYTIVDLFNCLWSKSPPLIIDTRDTIRFNISHVPFAIHIPITPADINFETNELITPLNTLGSRIPNPADQRLWRMRKGRAIVIVGQGPNDQDITAKHDVDIEALLRQGGQLDSEGAASNQGNGEDKPLSLSQPSNETNIPKVEFLMNEYDTTPHFVPALFASACLKENAANSVDIVSFGAHAFIDRYPFLMCSSMNARHATLSIPKLEERDIKHQHIPRFPAYPNEIIDQCVYLGSQADSEQRQQLEKLGITHIINATADLDSPFENETIELTHPETNVVIKQPLFNYLRLSMNDTHDQPLLEQLNIAFDFIDNALAGETLAGKNVVHGTPGKVLVHCQMGISRSASIIVAYVMRSFRCDLYNALAMVKSRRSQVLPNPAFIMELAKYECMLFGYDDINKSSYSKCISELYPNGIPAPKIAASSPIAAAAGPQ